jgi:hypothetical protein
MNHDHDLPTVSATYDRRGLFRIGGITIATAVLVAACADNAQEGQLGRVGNGADTPVLKDPVVNDGVLLRTSASIELSIAAAYQHMVKTGVLAKASSTFPKLGDQSALVAQFAKEHTAAADSFNALAVDAGAEAWTCGNPRLDSAFIDIIFERVEKGAAASADAKEIKPSDDPTRDMINLVYTLEALSAAASQALVPQVSQASYRAGAVKVGARSARRSALVALRINPGGYVNDADVANAQPGVTTTTAAPTTTQNIAATPTTAAADAAPPQTDIPLPVAVPSQYGSLAPITWIGGLGDENGVRLKLIFETPSLNSLTYPFDACPGDTTTATTG